MKEKVEMFTSVLPILDWFGLVWLSFSTVFFTLIPHDISHVFLKCLHAVSAFVVNKYCSHGYLFGYNLHFGSLQMVSSVLPDDTSALMVAII